MTLGLIEALLNNHSLMINVSSGDIEVAVSKVEANDNVISCVYDLGTTNLVAKKFLEKVESSLTSDSFTEIYEPFSRLVDRCALIQNDELHQIIQRIQKTALTHASSDFLKDNLSLILKDLERTRVLYGEASFNSQLNSLPPDLKSDREFVKKLIDFHPSLLSWADPSFRSDFEIALILLGKSFDNVSLIDDSLFKDIGFCLKLLEIYPEAYKKCEPSIFNNRQIIKKLISKGVLSVLSLIDKGYFSDKEIMGLFIEKQGLLLGRVSCELQNDYDLVLKAVRQSGSALRYAGVDQVKNKIIVLEAVTKDGLALEYASPENQNDIEIVRSAFENNPQSIHYASIDIKKDRSYAKEFIAKSPDVIKFFTPYHHDDKEVALCAISLDPRAFRLFAKDIQQDKEVVLTALAKDPSLFNLVNLTLLEDPDVRELVLAIHAKKIESVSYLPARLTDKIKQDYLAHLHVGIEGDYHRLLEVDLREFIDSLTIQEVACFDEMRLLEIKANYHYVLSELIDRIHKKKAYTGTPNHEDIAQLTLFYDTVCGYLNFIDGVLKDQPESRVERLQILRGASACGGGLLGELEQLHAVLSYRLGGMSLGLKLAAWRSWEFRSFVESEVLAQAQLVHASTNIHDRNILIWQLKDYLTGEIITPDHLAHQRSLTEILMRLFSQKNAIVLADNLSQELQHDEVLKDSLLEYIQLEYFQDVEPSATVLEALKSEDEEIAKLLKNLSIIKDGLAILLPGSEQNIPILPSLFSAITISLNLQCAKQQIQNILKREVTDLETTLYFEKKTLIQEFNLISLRLQELTSLSTLDFFNLSSFDLEKQITSRQKVRIKKHLAEEFLLRYRDDRGNFKPEGLVLILEKHGLVRKIV